ncbi:MAG: hypothetical protein PF482_03100 [Desulfobacteraceae bacterium]|nr:hypothetical protein [Desulfobacteraceae bacterium]
MLVEKVTTGGQILLTEKFVPACQAGYQCFICQVLHVFSEPLAIQASNRFKKPDFSGCG